MAENLKQRAYKEQKLVDDAKKVADAIKALEIKITAKTGGADKLFGSISNADLADVWQMLDNQSIENSSALLVEQSKEQVNILLLFVYIER